MNNQWATSPNDVTDYVGVMHSIFSTYWYNNCVLLFCSPAVHYGTMLLLANLRECTEKNRLVGLCGLRLCGGVLFSSDRTASPKVASQCKKNTRTRKWEAQSTFSEQSTWYHLCMCICMYYRESYTWRMQDGQRVYVYFSSKNDSIFKYTVVNFTVARFKSWALCVVCFKLDSCIFVHHQLWLKSVNTDIADQCRI